MFRKRRTATSLMLRVWHTVLVLLVIQLAIYVIVSWAADMYRKRAQQDFNAAAAKLNSVGGHIPYAELINRYAKANGINAEVVAAVIRAESSFQPRAVSPSGAYGLMQVIPGTWQQVNKEIKACSGRHAGECGPDCYFDPELNIRIGTYYLGRLYRYYNGNAVLAVAAYNAGPGAVDNYGAVPPYSETAEYVKRVIDYWYEAKHGEFSAAKTTESYLLKCRSAIVAALALTVLITLFTAYRLFKHYRSFRWR